MVIDDSSSATLVPILTNSIITGYISSLEYNFISKDNRYVPIISLVPILLHSAIPLIPTCLPSDVCQYSISKKLTSMASTNFFIGCVLMVYVDHFEHHPNLPSLGL